MAVFATIIIVILYYLKSEFLPFFEGQKSQNEIRIVSWNVSNFGWDNGYSSIRRDQIVQTLKDINADFICLQEAVLSYDTCMVNSLVWVSKALNMANYRYSFMNKDQFDVNHQFGDIIFSRYPMLTTDSILTSDGIKKYYTITTLIEGERVNITNLHLQSNSIYNNQISRFRIFRMYQRYIQNSIIREQHMKELLPHLEGNSNSIIVGDFNDLSTSDTYRLINKKYHDAFEVCGRGTETTFSKSFLKLRIDYIFYGDGILCKNAGVINTDISDHRPLIMDFEVL